MYYIEYRKSFGLITNSYIQAKYICIFKLNMLVSSSQMLFCIQAKFVCVFKLKIFHYQVKYFMGAE